MTSAIPAAAAETVIDPLHRAEILVPEGLAPAERCIVTVASAGFEDWLDDLLSSLAAYGGCQDAHVVVLALGEAPRVGEVAHRHGAHLVPCRMLAPLGPASKAVVYAMAKIVPTERFLCLDADMVVLGDLSPLFVALDVLPPGAVLVARDNERVRHLGAALDEIYGGGPDPAFFSRRSPLASYPLVLNDGLMAARRSALLALEARVRALPDVVRWVDERPDVRWRNQFAVNVALAKGACAVELDPIWNLQLNTRALEPCEDLDDVRWLGRRVRVLHFNGAGAKQRYDPLRRQLRARIAGAVPPPRPAST
ncbi:MAG TPA: hypothetical protein VI248_12420 [Kineosporiaceae bacterium]